MSDLAEMLASAKEAGYQQGRQDTIKEFADALMQKAEENYLTKHYNYAVVDDAQIEKIEKQIKEQDVPDTNVGKKEHENLPNQYSEQLWNEAYRRGRQDAINELLYEKWGDDNKSFSDERIDNEDLNKYDPFYKLRCGWNNCYDAIERRAEQIKEQKNEVQ